MNKLQIKMIVLMCMAFALMFLPSDSAPLNFLLTILIIFTSALLLILILALAKLNFFSRFINKRPYLNIKYGNINVSYLWKLNGGGIIFSYEFVRLITQKIGKVDHVFEYCAGPGFIGFNLLANNLCDKLTLADVNPEAIEAIKETIKNNNLEDKVTVYESDGLRNIPEYEKWDLVVGNPPWLPCSRKKVDIRVCDTNNNVHKDFYQNINKFLNPDGNILFIEGAEYTNINDFKNMIENNDLKVVESFKSVPFLKFFKGWKEYGKVDFSILLFLRLCLWSREAYFIWSKRK